jgi:hypothetical protein
MKRKWTGDAVSLKWSVWNKTIVAVVELTKMYTRD